MKAAKQHDIAAFVALLGEGVDVNQKKEGSEWTILHRLFSEIDHGSVNYEYNYTSIAENFEVRFD